MASIATVGKGKKQKTAVLITTSTHSVTTAHHMTLVRRAVSHLKAFHVPNVAFHSDYMPENALHSFNVESYKRRITEQTGIVERSRDAAWKVQHLKALVNEANEYSVFFGLRKKFKAIYSNEELDAIVEKKTARQAELDATRERRQRAEYLRLLVREFPLCAGKIHTAHQEKLVRQAKRLAELVELVAKWRNGESVYLPYDIPTMLRVQGEEIVTSRGARFPITHARLGLALVRRVRESGQPYQRNGHTLHLGPYAIDSIDSAGNVRAGCHDVSFQEIERIAPELDAIAGKCELATLPPIA